MFVCHRLNNYCQVYDLCQLYRFVGLLGLICDVLSGVGFLLQNPHKLDALWGMTFISHNIINSFDVMLVRRYRWGGKFCCLVLPQQTVLGKT